MSILNIIRPDIPAGSKDKFLAAWPVLAADLKSQPGVLHAIGGQIIAEDGCIVEDFKFIQYIAFGSKEDEETFAKSAWAQEHQARLEARGAPEPTVGRFEFSKLSTNEPLQPYLQLTSITLPSEQKREEARSTWSELMTALGKEAQGGKLIRDDAFTGITLVEWDDVKEVEEAYGNDKAAAILSAFKALGQVKTLLVKLL